MTAGPADHDRTGESAGNSHVPTIRSILGGILRNDRVDADGFRISLWSGFYTTPMFNKIERTYGLLRDENNILFCLAFDGQLTAKSISDVLGRPKNSISRAVEQLLRKELIRREPVKSDRRWALLTIEPAGLAVIEKTSALFRQRENEMLKCLSPVERVALDHILAKLIQDAEHWLKPF
ncbi:MAG TPA: MarR family transcriptional regulator [Geminicoccus sp.]|jgi:DNA-binding MarR family transcriptional regulator|uniref:MarR family winged helix-turn-helix transcriptional regulator n=1 Tax=Geminicoccus sp. TaxID=2024832 RepID=UPI002E3594C3|nr:MarR family transcriptional regulator [Geminicoccus sp.]HEX2525747.1 MarR family transcriptional regulator [Geminicoccus sp.]